MPKTLNNNKQSVYIYVNTRQNENINQKANKVCLTKPTIYSFKAIIIGFTINPMKNDCLFAIIFTENGFYLIWVYSLQIKKNR